MRRIASVRPIRSARRRARPLLPAFLLGLLLAGLTIPAGAARAAATEWVGDAHAAARLITAVEATGSATRLDAGLQIRLAPGWHAYWRTPGDGGLAPSLDWQGSENVEGAAIAWPAPRRFSVDGLETQVYEDGVVLPISVGLARPGEPVLLRADVDYAACKEVCIPYHASLALGLPPGLAVPGPEAARIAAARAKVPGNFEASGLRLVSALVAPEKDAAVLAVRVASIGARLQAPDLFIEGIGHGSPARPDVALSESGDLATFRVPIRDASAAAIAGTTLRLTLVDGARAAEIEATPVLGMPPPAPGGTARIGIVGLALLGGLVLNLMPCVLPVLSMKLLALVGYAGADRRVARLGLLATAGGVIVSFAALAATLIGLKAAGAAIGWGIQFQQPWFLATMALATTVFAASLWGWLPMGLPAGIAGAVGAVRGRGRLADAFLMGVFATLLASSCSAPFVGTALGFALARGPLDIALVFGSLGLGMAAPFLLVAARPGLVAWLPRPGRWLDWLRRAMGLALLATAAWLITILATEVGLGSAATAGVALLTLLLVLGLRGRLGAGRAIGASAVALAVVAVLVPSLRGEAEPPGVARPAELWRPFDADAVRRLVGQGMIVYVDVSAAWCLTCKVNEITVLDRAPVAGLLRGPNVVAMRADWTRPDPAITAYLQSFGRYGVPLDVVYGPGAPAGIALPELLTSAAVQDAFRRAVAAAPQAARE